MPYPKKLELNIENDIQAAILYACFNRSGEEVLKSLLGCRDDEVKNILLYFKDKTNKEILKDACLGDYVFSCWKKVRDIMKYEPIIPKEVVNKKKSRDNIAKIVVEVNEVKKSVKILGFKNIKTYGELPKNYVKDFPHFFISVDKTLQIRKGADEKGIYLHEGGVYDKHEFEIILGIMKIAGIRLTQINRKEKIVTKEFSI